MSGGLFAHEQGTDEKTPVVLLHGFGGMHTVWSDVQQALARYCRTLAYDLPGHGKSLDWVGRLVPAKMASALWYDLDARGEKNLHLVGHSMGGAIATLMAMSAPARVASLTLLAPGGFGTEINGRLLRRYAAATDEASLRIVLENMFGWTNQVPDESVRRTVTNRNISGQVEKLSEIAAHITRDDKQGVLPREELAKLPMPIKVIWGTQDRVLPTRQAHRLPGRFAAHIFEDTGHMLPEEIPDDIVWLVRENIRNP